jgi:hypothetical protein
MSCNTRCNICERIVFSNSITVAGGTLVINIANGSYADCQKFCLILIQNIPDTATINMPVGITIGTDTTVYPMVRCDCTQVTACALRTRTRYPMKVATTATSAVFKVLRNLSCAPDNRLAAVPVPATPAPTA